MQYVRALVICHNTNNAAMIKILLLSIPSKRQSFIK